MSRWERIAPPWIDWGTTLCSSRHCTEEATVALDGWPYCLTCADDQVERWVAFSLNPGLVASLPSLEDR